MPYLKDQALRAALIIKTVFKKYRQDNGNIIVSSISFYVLLAFIPFTLLSISILGYVIDLSNPAAHLERYLKTILPDPYNAIIAKRILRELNFISTMKRLSGPLGLLFLFFFTTRLFSVLRPSFQIIFGKTNSGFIRDKGMEILLTAIFSLVQAILFFSFVFIVVVQSRVIKQIPSFLSKTPFLYLFSLLDMAITFAMFYLLYYLLTPAMRRRIRVVGTVVATLFWYCGKYLFKHYILQVGKFTSFFGTYGVSIAFLFWVYFSVFVFISCAELQAVLMSLPNRVPRPSSGPYRWRPSKVRKVL
jgi:membrane protein